MRITTKSILSSILFTFSYLLKVKGNEFNDDFLKDIKRVELVILTDYNVPDIYINMPEDMMEELFNQGSGGMGKRKGPGNAKNANGDRPKAPVDGNRPPFDEGGFPNNNNLLIFFRILLLTVKFRMITWVISQIFQTVKCLVRMLLLFHLIL